jgi:hypothetical protein
VEVQTVKGWSSPGLRMLVDLFWRRVREDIRRRIA